MIPILIKQLSADGFQWNQYSGRVATISNELRHFRPVAYFHFSDWNSAHKFWKAITEMRHCTRAQVRESERFTTGWEVKTWNMSQSVLEAMIQRDTRKVVPLGHRDCTPESLPHATHSPRLAHC